MLWFDFLSPNLVLQLTNHSNQVEEVEGAEWAEEVECFDHPAFIFELWFDFLSLNLVLQLTNRSSATRQKRPIEHSTILPRLISFRKFSPLCAAQPRGKEPRNSIAPGFLLLCSEGTSLTKHRGENFPMKIRWGKGRRTRQKRKEF